VTHNSLQIVTSVHKPETHKSHLGGALGANEPWLHIEHVWVEETVGLVIMGIVLTVESRFNGEYIGLGVFGDLGTDVVIGDALSLHVYSILIVPELDI